MTDINVYENWTKELSLLTNMSEMSILPILNCSVICENLDCHMLRPRYVMIHRHGGVFLVVFFVVIDVIFWGSFRCCLLSCYRFIIYILDWSYLFEKNPDDTYTSVHTLMPRSYDKYKAQNANKTCRPISFMGPNYFL